MSNTKYATMKYHFDRLMRGGYPASNGLEPIRSTYERAFDMKINMQDVYQTKLDIPTNPIKGIITLVGPEPKKDQRDIPTGLIGMNETEVYLVDQYDDSVFKGTAGKFTSKTYTESVFYNMQTIIKMDRYMAMEKHIFQNPYVALLWAYPFYFTYHHLKDAAPEFLTEQVLFDILEKYYMDSDLIPQVLESISSRKYSEDSEDIYSIMTCKGTIDII